MIVRSCIARDDFLGACRILRVSRAMQISDVQGTSLFRRARQAWTSRHFEWRSWTTRAPSVLIRTSDLKKVYLFYSVISLKGQIFLFSDLRISLFVFLFFILLSFYYTDKYSFFRPGDQFCTCPKVVRSLGGLDTKTAQNVTQNKLLFQKSKPLTWMKKREKK